MKDLAKTVIENEGARRKANMLTAQYKRAAEEARLHSYRVVYNGTHKYIIGPEQRAPLARPNGRHGVWSLEEIAAALNAARELGCREGIAEERARHRKRSNLRSFGANESGV
jgi:hypothetical protein